MNSGELIRELRKERKITQAQLAEGIVHRTTLNSFENENSTTSCEVLFQYLDKLNMVWSPKPYFVLFSILKTLI